MTSARSPVEGTVQAQEPSDEVLLSAREVSKSFGGLQAVSGVTTRPFDPSEQPDCAVGVTQHVIFTPAQ